MRHEVGDAFEHAPGLEHERRERHLVQIHSHSGALRQPWRGGGRGRGYAMWLGGGGRGTKGRTSAGR